MTKTELENAITETLYEIIRLKAIWHEANDEQARKRVKVLQILQCWYLEQYENIEKINH